MRGPSVLLALTVLAACNQNTSVGNDREAQLDPAPTPAPVLAPLAALDNVATESIKPQTFSGADIAALGGLEGKCAVRLTEVAHPSFVYSAGRAGTIKLNGKLIPLTSAGENRFARGGLGVTLRPNGERGDAGLAGIDMIIVRPGAKGELGYSGFVDCWKEESQ